MIIDGDAESQDTGREGAGCSQSFCPEMAYVVLNDCEIEVFRRRVRGGLNDEEDLEAMRKPPSVPLDKWIELEFFRDESSRISMPAFSDLESGNHKTVKVSENEEVQLVEFPCELTREPAAEETRCRHCYLAIQQEIGDQITSEGTLGPFGIDWGSIPPFSGYESEVLHTPCRRAKSDASLLLGLLRCVEDVVHVRHCMFRFYGKDEGCGASDTRRGTMVVTLTFPLLNWQESQGARSILGGRGQRAWQKPLPSALQLLLSLVRSDWENLDQLLANAPTPPTSRREPLTFFPHKLSLDALYQRLPSSASAPATIGKRVVKSSLKEQANGVSPLSELPEEILRTKLVPFLAAHDLERLRWSCSQMYMALRAVVPGLKLRLYSHQIQSLCWMRERESRMIREADCLQSDYMICSPDGDLHRAATGGLTVLLRERSRESEANLNEVSPVIRIHQCYGTEVSDDEVLSSTRGLGRGGLLCDDPGLGKTITLLSLFLQTYGVSAQRTSRGEPAATSTDSRSSLEIESIFQPYWAEMLTSEFRMPLLHKLINRLLRSHEGSGILPPERILLVRESIQKDSYLTFSRFEHDVEDAIQHYAPDDEAATGRQRLLFEFRSLVEDFKATQSKSAKKAYSNASGRHKSRVAAVIAKQSQEKFLDQLVPSCSTLLVIPHVLMEHWQAQISMHVDFKYLTERIPLIFDFGKVESKGGLSVNEVIRLCQVTKTHAPLVFLDRGGTRSLPPADFLAMFRLVITSTDRFKNEWSKGSFQNELKQSDEIDKTSMYEAYIKPDEACPLLKVHWLRLVVDEGHSMGRSQSSSTIQFASWVYAQRRWAMTGTPTKNSSELGQLRSLMKFLQHDFFGIALDGSTWWRNGMLKPWREGSQTAFFRLQTLLSLLMKRHTKLDIHELPLPRFEQTIIPMSSIEVATYNTLVCGVQSNILLTSMEGKTSGEQDSLLHRSQARHARDALANIRRVCVGWSRVIPTLSLKAFHETIHLLESHGFSDEKIAEIRQYLFRPEEEKLTACDCCGLQLSTQLLLPCCGNFICPECMDRYTKTCVLCEKVLNVDDFQRLQPGFVLTWKSNLGSPSLKVTLTASPQRQQHQLSHHVVDERAVINHLNQPRGRYRQSKDHVCEYDYTAGDGVCITCRQGHEGCTLFNPEMRCPVCHRMAQECPPDESKGAYLVKKLEDLVTQSRNGFSPDHRPPKAIVFSQFRKALDVIGDRLLNRFGSNCVAEYWGRFRTQELRKFTHERDCFCMLLSNDGSEGLDLSFVTHIFFLEEIWDSSLRDQTVARAWRMGATGSVSVETLLAKNSVEELMQNIEPVLRGEKHGDGASSSLDDLSRSPKDYQEAKTKILLRSLRLLTDFHYFAKSDSSSLKSKSLVTSSKAPSSAAQKRKVSSEDMDSCEMTKRVRFQELTTDPVG